MEDVPPAWLPPLPLSGPAAADACAWCRRSGASRIAGRSPSCASSTAATRTAARARSGACAPAPEPLGRADGLRQQPRHAMVERANASTPACSWRWTSAGRRRVDSVLLECSHDQWKIRLRLEGQDASGRWHQLAAEPEAQDRPPLMGLRRAATDELKLRGFDYILVYDSDFGAEDFQQESEVVEHRVGRRSARRPALPHLMKLFLGVDGGQSSTTALIGDETGRVLGVGVGRPVQPRRRGGGRREARPRRRRVRGPSLRTGRAGRRHGALRSRLLRHERRPGRQGRESSPTSCAWTGWSSPTTP